MRIYRTVLLALGLVGLLGTAFLSTASAQSAGPTISAPLAGDALQGAIAILGTSQVGGFASAELDFAYSGDATHTWFLIATSSQPVEAGNLDTWDTTAVTDGTYDLRLRVTLTSGKTVDAIVPDLRVRNYTPVETSTPTVTPTFLLAATPVPTATATLIPSPYPTPTEMPPNPVTVTPADLLASLAYGGSGVLVLFLILVLYRRMRRK
jgi:hypothetical protein